MKICGIVVTFNAGLKFKDNLLSYVDQLDYIVIVDNDSDDLTKELLKNLELEHKNKIQVILNNENLGLARAQNIGIKIALKKDFDFVMLLDDDSIMDDNMVEILLNSYRELNKTIQNIGIIAPNICRLDINSKQMHYLTSSDNISFARKTFGKEKYLDVLTVIASGSMIKSELLKKIGLMREDFFIYYVDCEFCLRAIDNNYRIFAVRDANLFHKIGNPKLINLWFVNIETVNYDPSRRFIIYRNKIWTWKLYWRRIPAFVIYDFLTSIYQTLKIIIFESNKLANIQNIFKGIKAGFFTCKNNIEIEIEP
jgi:rhamnosyltransferase